MFIAAEPSAMREWSRARAADHRVVSLVPTMGALHDGHVALINEARRRSDDVVVSIFVNPLQFDRPADFSTYPRPIDDDLARCAAEGVDAVYAPTPPAMYPPGFETHVQPGALADVLEGAQRPGHFRGVTTVVTKLFAAVEPRAAVFGEKDFQQLAIIRRMTRDLDLGIDIIGVSTVREPDGLAMSSRNRRLTSEQRAAAVCVPRSLEALASAAAGGVRDAAQLVRTAQAIVEREPMARFEHLELVDADTLHAVEELPDEPGRVVALTAVWFGDVRLIDNRRI